MYEDDLGPGPFPVARPARVVSNAVLGTLIFIFTETMLFAGFISAFMIVRTSALGAWPPPGQPRLPAEETAINTGALLLSGVLLILANRSYPREPGRTSVLLGLSILLGAFFVLFQGFEWVAMLSQGLTLTSSQQGSFFYVIVGMHAIHAIAALIALGYVWMRLQQARLSRERFYASQAFWYFVVLLWPIIYTRVYL
jgi:cytochrome c oxidase subunit 3